VFDATFTFVKSFTDPTVPAGYAPFGIQAVGSELYVTFAKQLAPDNQDDAPGLGNGYVDIFNPDGTLAKRFASQGNLNSPWAVAVAPTGFGAFSHDLLIGNFGDGRIGAYDSEYRHLHRLRARWRWQPNRDQRVVGARPRAGRGLLGRILHLGAGRGGPRPARHAQGEVAERNLMHRGGALGADRNPAPWPVTVRPRISRTRVQRAGLHIDTLVFRASRPFGDFKGVSE